MNIIGNIKSSFGEHDLRRKTKSLNRRKAIHNFSTAETAGILFHCSDEEDFRAVKNFKQFLENQQIKVEVLGYVHDKQVPDHYLLRTGFNFFCMKDLNWFRRPARPFALEFALRKFDILFDLSIREYFPLHYVSSISPAAYKVGVFRENNNYDLMIDLTEEKTISYFLKQVKYYLTLIHSKSS